MGFSGQEHWSGLLSPLPLDRAWSELFTGTRASLVGLQSMVHSSISQALLPNKAVICEGGSWPFKTANQIFFLIIGFQTSFDSDFCTKSIILKLILHIYRCVFFMCEDFQFV